LFTICTVYTVFSGVLLAAFNRYILMVALILLHRVDSHIPLEIVKMIIKYMDFEEHTTIHFVVDLHQSLNQLRIDFGLVISQEASNHYNSRSKPLSSY